MSMFPNTNSRPIQLEYGTDDRAVFNFFNAVYAWMCVGLAVTATCAWLVSQNTQLVMALFSRGVALVFVLGSLVVVWSIRSAAMRLSPGIALALFVLYSAIVGVFLSGIFVIYRLESIAGVFVVTAGTFGATSLYGYLTKRDLTSMGSFLFMAVWGLFLATIVNIFWANSTLYWVITYAGLAIFIGLTAYDTQKLKQFAYSAQGNNALAQRMAVIGSLELYLDFINMFLFLLRILGKRR